MDDKGERHFCRKGSVEQEDKGKSRERPWKGGEFKVIEKGKHVSEAKTERLGEEEWEEE